MFTYKIYFSQISNSYYLHLIPDNNFYTRFGVGAYSVYDIVNTIIFINETTYIEMSFYEHLLNKKILYEVINFYLDNNFSEYIDFKYDKKDLFWEIRFKITNTKLLLELL